MNKKTIFSATSLVILLLLAIILAAFPDRYINSAFSGLVLFSKCVLPALFPFFFITAILSKMQIITKVTKFFAKPTKFFFKSPAVSSYVYFMSIISGYPVGCKIIADLYENKIISDKEATKMSTFCSTSGPLFIIGSIGAGMLINKQAGFLLYFTHILAGFLTGIFFRNIYPYQNKTASNLPLKKVNLDNIFGDAVYSSVISILTVGGFITLFYILADILLDFKVLLPLNLLVSLLLLPFTKDVNIQKGATLGLIESTKGCSILAGISSPIILPIIAFILSFGGISILIQQICYLKKANAKIKIFLFSKLLHAFLSFFICYILIKIF